MKKTMREIKCPKCKKQIQLTHAQMDLLESNRRILCSCSACNYLFDYEYTKPYKRPFKFIIFSFCGRGTPLKNGDRVLNHLEYQYNAPRHCVSKRVIVPNGPQGYVEQTIPEKIKTHEELGAYLDAKNDN